MSSRFLQDDCPEPDQNKMATLAIQLTAKALQTSQKFEPNSINNSFTVSVKYTAEDIIKNIYIYYYNK